MSEQNKSNVQALGAGLIGFIAVMAVGGGAMLLHSSLQSKAPIRAAAAPIDLAAPAKLQRPFARPQHEARAESPAPLVGSEDESTPARASGASAVPGAGDVSVPRDDKSAKGAALEVAGHLDATGSGSSAKSEVKAAAVAAKALKKPGRKAAAKAEAPDTAALASVHYGVTSRSELMGRAAGPVYNIAGGSAKGSTAGRGKLAGDFKDTITDLQRKLEAAGMPAEQRASLQKELAEATKNMGDPGTTQ